MFLCLALITQLFISRSLQTPTCPVPFFNCSFVLPLISTSLCGESCANTEVLPVPTLSSLQPMLQPLEVGVHQCSCSNYVSLPQGWGQGSLGNQQRFGSLWEVWEVSVSFSLILLSSLPSTCDFLEGPAQEGLHYAMMAQVTAGLDPIVAEGWDMGHLGDLLLQLPISTPSSFSSLRTWDPAHRLLLFWPLCSMCAHCDVFWSNHTPLHVLLSPQSSLGPSFPICSPCTVFQS